MGIGGYIICALLAILADSLWSTPADPAVVKFSVRQRWQAQFITLVFRALWVLWIVKIASLI